MLRRLILYVLPALPALGAPSVFPEEFAGFKRTAVRPVSLDDRGVWEEYGLEQAEHAAYEDGPRHFLATAWRMKDPTGAYAAFQWQRPAQARTVRLFEPPKPAPAKNGAKAQPPPALGPDVQAVESDAGLMLLFGNYLLAFQDFRPDQAQLLALFGHLPRLDQSALPPVSAYLPTDELHPNSERLVLGPASLDRFGPKVPPSLVAFHTGAEAQLGRYRGKVGDLDLAVISYPTPHIARERLSQFQKIDGVMVKRTGPLLALIMSPKDLDQAERLLARVNYRATITLSEGIPKEEGGVGEMLIAIFSLTGLLLLFALVVGLLMAGFRLVGRKWMGKSSSDPMTLLHLEDR